MKWLIPTIAASVAGLLCTSCVHEWPETKPSRPLTLTVTHTLGWEFHEHTPTRGHGQTHTQRYRYMLYPRGTTSFPVSAGVFYVEDDSRADFDITLDVPAGEHDLYIWSDNVPAANPGDHHFDTSTPSAITYTLPYKGADPQKEAYRGMTQVSVPASVDEEARAFGSVNLEMPLTSYAFVSTDLEKFLEKETLALRTRAVATEGVTADDLDGYTVKASYPYYHPSVYNLFTDKPVDSATGVSYTAQLSLLEGGQALVCFDHMFINGAESGTRVALEIYDPEGNRVAATGGIDLPVKRGRCTIVRGEFLTSETSGPTLIDPDFDGDFNVEIR